MFQSNCVAGKRGNAYDAIIFATISVGVSFLLILFDRSRVIDNNNYIRYFSDDGALYGFLQKLVSTDGFFGSLPWFFSEEFVWQIYVAFVGSILKADHAVVFTVVVVNFVFMYSAWKMGGGLIGCLLWIIMPVCLSVIGFYQIRQGLAVSLFVLCCVLEIYPLVAAVFVSMIHTTFIVPCVVVFFMSFDFLWRRKYVLLFTVFVVFFAVVLVADKFFSDFAGRRAEVYDASEGASSINFLIGVFVMMLPSVYIFFRVPHDFDKNIVKLSFIHIGVSIWLLLAFVFFPIGTSRVGYYSQILSIIPIGALLLKKSTAALSIGLLYMLMVAIFIYGALRDGGYYEILNAGFWFNS